MTICRTDAECEEAGRQRVRDMGWKLTQRQRERLWVLLRPYAGQLLGNPEPADTRPHDAA